jgi:hypothetical protein
VGYKGEVRVRVIGLWERGHAEPLWVMSNPEPEEAVRMYLQRMKIDATFRDLKDLLGLERLMNRSQESMEKMVALLLLTYTIGHLVEENLRDFLYGPPPSESRVSEPAGASQQRFSSPGSPGHPLPGAGESSGPAPAKPVGTEMEALPRSVRTPHAEVVRDVSAVASHRPGCFGFVAGYPPSFCRNWCPNLKYNLLTGPENC